jgi:hypothetical protein
MVGLISTKKLMKQVPRYATGDEVVKIPTAAEELGISDVKTPFMEEYGKNIKGASEFAVDHAVGELENQIAQELKSRGYKIEFDWKGFKNWIMGKNPDGSSKLKEGKLTKDWQKQNRQQFMKFLNKTPAGAARNMLWRGALKIGKNIASPAIKTIQEYLDDPKVFSQSGGRFNRPLEEGTTNFQDMLAMDGKVITPKPHLLTHTKANIPMQTKELARRGFYKSSSAKIYPADWLEYTTKDRKWKLKEKYAYVDFELINDDQGLPISYKINYKKNTNKFLRDAFLDPNEGSKIRDMGKDELQAYLKDTYGVTIDSSNISRTRMAVGKLTPKGEFGKKVKEINITGFIETLPNADKMTAEEIYNLDHPTMEKYRKIVESGDFGGINHIKEIRTKLGIEIDKSATSKKMWAEGKMEKVLTPLNWEENKDVADALTKFFTDDPNRIRLSSPDVGKLFSKEEQELMTTPDPKQSDGLSWRRLQDWRKARGFSIPGPEKKGISPYQKKAEVRNPELTEKMNFQVSETLPNGEVVWSRPIKDLYTTKVDRTLSDGTVVPSERTLIVQAHSYGSGKIVNPVNADQIANKEIFFPPDVRNITDMPQFFLTLALNNTHRGYENNLTKNLLEKYNILGFDFKVTEFDKDGLGSEGKWTGSLKKNLSKDDQVKLKRLDNLIKDDTKRLDNMNAYSMFYNPVTEKVVTYGKPLHEIPGLSNLITSAKEQKQMKNIALSSGEIEPGIIKKGKGGMIQKFDNGGEAEATGISSEPLSEEQDTSGLAGLMEEDVNKFIPPNLRFAKNLTGNMVLDFGAEMARYMTPGLGEYLSQEDYKLYSSELAQAVQNKEFLAAAGLAIPTALAMAGTMPNWTLVGVPISMAEAAVKKVIKPKLKQLEKPKDIRYKIRDKDGKTVYQTKNKQEAEDKAQKLSGDTGEDYIVDEIEFMPKEKVEVIESKPYDIVNDAGQVVATRRNQNQAEKYLRRHPNENLKMVERNLPDVPRIDTTRLIDVGDNRQFYSKSQQAFDNGFDLSTGDAALTAKEWHDFFRRNGVREQELVDSYVRTLLDRKGGFNKETQTFTSNTKIKASEVKDLIDNAPAMKVQSVQFSDASGNLKYGDTGRMSGAEAGSKRENVIWIDSADIRGDPGQLSSLAKSEGTQHKNFYDVKTDTVKFDAGKAKLDGEPYVIAWSLVDTRKGKDAFGKAIKVDLASEIQSDLLQKAATQKAKLKQKIAQLGTGNVQQKQKLLQEIEYIFRPMGKTSTEIQELIQRLTANQQKFTAASKLELDDINPALLKELDQAKIDRDAILTDMFNIVDNVSINDLYPNLPLKNSKDWVDTVVKNDVYLAAKNRFTILDDGTIKINENAPSHYAPNSPEVVKQHWSSTGDEAGQMYDIIYNNAADSLKRIAKTTGSDVQLGKVKQGGSFVEVPMIELVPEMLYSQVQYFKDGGLVQKQYSPLVPLFKPLGVSYGY